jgi:hypothetical protein
MVLLACLASAGCGKTRETLNYTVGQKGGKALQSLKGTTIVFEGIGVDGPDNERKATGIFLVSGPGTVTANGQVTVDDVTLSATYADGVATVRVDSYSFKIVANGTRLEFPNQRFDLGSGTRTLLVDQNGAARVKE